MVLPKLKRHLIAKNTSSDHDSIHGHRNLNYTERSPIARHRNFNAPKCCKITVERLSKPNIRFGSERTGSKIVSKFRLIHNRKLRSAYRNTIDHTIACPALLLWCPAVENRGPCVPKKCSLSNCASPGYSFCPVLDHW